MARKMKNGKLKENGREKVVYGECMAILMREISMNYDK